MGIKAILTDIEGTITSLSFVKEILFPYSKERMKDFVLQKAQTDSRILPLIDEVLSISKSQIKESSVEEKLATAIEILLNWIQLDKKATPLKEIQGLIWEEGYKLGDFKGHLYQDAYEKLKELKEQGLLLYVYSSGSVKAQKELFQYSEFGDIRNLFSGFFDTHIGNKKEARSYTQIAKLIGLKPNEILFLSDVEEELDAAEEAGMKTTLIQRPVDYPQKESPKKSPRLILSSMNKL